MTRVGCVVLTQGQRPAELRRALDSILAQRGVDLDLVVVGNGWEPAGLPPGARRVGLPENLGIPAGRNAGVPHVAGELLFFLDDDAQLESPNALERVAEMFAGEPGLGLLQLRVRDPEGRPPARQWVPRLRVGDPGRSSDVTAVWEGAVAITRELFEQVGGWPDQIFYAHEGIELAWLVLDAGRRVRYTGEIVALHPAYPPARHSFSVFYSLRNRVWLARRYLPLPLGAVYASAWLLMMVARFRSRREVREALRGFRAGLREPYGERRRLRWRTIWRMTRAGRPPIL
jgi:GT2 family glycosyltransferase